MTYYCIAPSDGRQTDAEVVRESHPGSHSWAIYEMLARPLSITPIHRFPTRRRARKFLRQMEKFHRMFKESQ